MTRNQTTFSLLFDIFFGAVPASVLAFAALFLVAMALEDPYLHNGLIEHFFGGATLAVAAGVGGLMGAVGLWTAVLTAGEELYRTWLRRFMAICLIAGIGAALLVVAQAFGQPADAVSRFYWRLTALGPLVVAAKYLLMWALER